MREKIETVDEKRQILVPHLGLTLRVLHAVAAEAFRRTNSRSWKLVYKDADIGTIRVRKTQT